MERTPSLPFRDRRAAGRELAARLSHYADRSDVVVLALPRGGVPVGFEVARALHAPLDVLIVRKLGVPGRDELAMGAVASGGAQVLNASLIEALRIPTALVEAELAREQQELERRERAYRSDRPPLELHDRTVILVDDGIATGATMRAAVAAVRTLQPARLVVAAPTAAREACDMLRSLVDEGVCLALPDPYIAVGVWYQEFPQTSDAEVRELLAK